MSLYTEISPVIVRYETGLLQRSSDNSWTGWAATATRTELNYGALDIEYGVELVLGSHRCVLLRDSHVMFSIHHLLPY